MAFDIYIGVLSRFWLFCLGPLVLLLPIIWLSGLSILSVPDEGYSRNALCALNLIATFLLHLAATCIDKATLDARKRQQQTADQYDQ
jgi:hypothetical protein